MNINTDRQIKIVSTETKKVNVTPSMAEILVNSVHPDQRKVNQMRVLKYANAMKSGGWSVDTADDIILGRLDSSSMDGMQWLVLNGQHRLRAIIEANIEIPCSVKSITFADSDSMRHAYALIDGGMARNSDATIRALGVHDHIGVPADVARKALAAIKLIAWDFAQANNNNLDRQIWNTIYDEERALLYFKKEISAFNKATLSAKRSMRTAVLSRPVMALGIVTFKYTPLDAHNFWNAVAQPMELKRGTPEFALYEYLGENYRVGTNNMLFDHCKRIAAAWNAYARGEQIKLLKAGTAEIQIACTPFDGKTGKTGLALIKDAIVQGDDIVGEEDN